MAEILSERHHQSQRVAHYSAGGVPLPGSESTEKDPRSSKTRSRRVSAEPLEADLASGYFALVRWRDR